MMLEQLGGSGRRKGKFIRAFELPALDFALSDKALQVRSQQVNNKRGGVAG
jgi:hypothetical protein